MFKIFVILANIAGTPIGTFTPVEFYPTKGACDAVLLTKMAEIHAAVQPRAKVLEGSCARASVQPA